MVSMSDHEPAAERRAARLARRIAGFAREHGGAEAVLEHLGRSGTRIVLVGADGWWGDLVASGPVAHRATELAGITPHDTFDASLAANLRTGPYEWRRMAGIQGPVRWSNSARSSLIRAAD